MSVQWIVLLGGGFIGAVVTSLVLFRVSEAGTEE